MKLQIACASHRRLDRCGMFHVSSGEKILKIFLLRKNNTIVEISNFNSQEVVKFFKISQLEFFGQLSYAGMNNIGVTPCDDNIINIDKDIKNITIVVFNKERRVSMRACKTNC